MIQYMNKTYIKSLEKNIFNSVIDNFIDQKNNYIESSVENTLKSMFFDDFTEFKYSEKFLYQASTFFFPFVKKLISILQYPVANKFSVIMQNIVDEVLITGSRINDPELKEYFKMILNFFCQKCVEFNDFIKKYEIINDNHFLKEYFIACFVPIMLYPIGKVKNFILLEKIFKIWIVADNLSDFSLIDKNKSSSLIQQLSPFFTKKLYLHSEIKNNFLLNTQNPIIQCLKEIDELDINNDLKILIFKRLGKLYKLSYSIKGKKNDFLIKNEKKLIKYACLKSRKSLDIFILAIDLNENEFNYILRKDFNQEFFLKLYNLSLAIQLLDDLLDIRKDIQDNCNSIFTTSDKKNCFAWCIVINNVFQQYSGPVQYYFKVLQMLFMSYNHQYLADGVKETIEENVKFMNLKVYNMDIIFDLMNDRQFMVNSFNAYLFNNRADFFKIDRNEIIKELENIQE